MMLFYVSAEPLYLCFVFALCERKNETQKEDKVPLRKMTSEPPRKPCKSQMEVVDGAWNDRAGPHGREYDPAADARRP